jgi:hypothetical protein
MVLWKCALHGFLFCLDKDVSTSTSVTSAQFVFFEGLAVTTQQFPSATNGTTNHAFAHRLSTAISDITSTEGISAPRRDETLANQGRQSSDQFYKKSYHVFADQKR